MCYAYSILPLYIFWQNLSFLKFVHKCLCLALRVSTDVNACAIRVDCRYDGLAVDKSSSDALCTINKVDPYLQRNCLSIQITRVSVLPRRSHCNATIFDHGKCPLIPLQTSTCWYIAIILLTPTYVRVFRENGALKKE